MPLAADTRLVSLGRIAEAWRDVARRGRRRVVVVTGGPGAGKSRLVARALASLTPAPGTTLIGHGRPGDVGPYDWTATAFAGLDEEGRRTDPAAHAPRRPDPPPTKNIYFGRIRLRTSVRREDAPEDAAPVPSDAFAWLTRRTDGQAARMEPTALRRAAIAYVRRLTGERAAVLVAENAHALDPASLDLLTALAVDGPPTLVVVVARRTHPRGPHRLAHAAIRELAAIGGAVTVALPDPRPSTRTVDDLVAWARYAKTVDDPDARAAALEAAAGLLRTGRVDAARDLMDECLADPATPGGEHEHSTRLALARALLALGRVESAGRVADDLDDEPGSTEFAEALRVIDEITSRERDVLDCLAAGMTNQQTATALGISIRTVTVHVSNVLRKTGTGSRTEAALWAVQHGLVRPEQPGRRR